MAARSRPRAGPVKDEIDEERSIWSQIRSDAKRIDHLMAQSDAAQKKFLELKADQEARTARGQSPSSSVDSEMEKVIRENVAITEKLQDLLKEDGESSNIMNKLEILAALRDSHEPDTTSTSRAASVGKSQRDRNPNKRKLTDTLEDRDSVAADSPAPGPSPKVVINQKDRLIAKSGSSRAGSVPAGRESSVKADDDKDDQGKESAKHRLTVHTEVLYRNNKSRNLEGEGILCRVTSVIGEGKQRRYEIIDSDPDPPTPAQPYRASVNHLVAIPPPNTNLVLKDLEKGKNVLALYPGTTTFYKAEVVSGWTAKGGVKMEEGRENLVRLRFEGEDEADREMSVERRYVLPDK